MMVAHGGELETIRECGRRLAAVTAHLVAEVRPGLTTAELDHLAERLIVAAGGDPIFKGYRQRRSEPPFPASLCASVNDEVVHGIPRAERVLREGDLVGLDIGMRWPSERQASSVKRQKLVEGLITDMAVTVPVGAISPPAKRLLTATRQALERGIGALKAGIHLGDLGHAVEEAIASQGFSVVRDLVGHGVGRRLHEDPFVPNYGTPGEGAIVREGMVLAIEPMATAGGPAVRLDPDGWTWRTADGSLAAHFEHTVLITKDGAEVLTEL